MSVSFSISQTNLKTFLVDTNVWLDYFLPFREDHETAFKFIDRSIENAIPLFYSVIQPQDILYIAEVTLKRDLRQKVGAVKEADALAINRSCWAFFQNLRQLACVVGADESDLWLAEKYYHVHPDFEDDLVMAAVTRAGATYLVTNDEKLRANAPVPTISVAGALALMEA